MSSGRFSGLCLECVDQRRNDGKLVVSELVRLILIFAPARDRTAETAA
jgi:hypothetical protein